MVYVMKPVPTPLCLEHSFHALRATLTLTSPTLTPLWDLGIEEIVTFDWCYHWDIGIIWLYSKLSVKFYLPDLLLASCLSVAFEPLTVIRGIGD